MYTLKAYAGNSLWNVSPSETLLGPTDILIRNNSTSTTVYGLIPLYNAEFVATGQFNIPPGAIDATGITGTMASRRIYIDGITHQTEEWTTYNDISRYDFAYELEQLSGNDWFEGSTFANRDFIQGLAGNDSFKGYGDDSYGDFFYGGSGTDRAIFRGTSSEYRIDQVTDIWDYRTDANPQVSGTRVTDLVQNRDGIDNLNEVELLQFSNKTTIASYNTDGIYRFYNTQTGTHFYTGSLNEAETVLTNLPQFIFEGQSFEKNTSSGGDAINVFRFFNTQTGTHFFTASASEASQVRTTLPQYNDEGIAYNAHNQKVAGTTELYRFFNTQTGTHFYTANTDEMINVVTTLSGIYKYEGIAYYVDA